MMEFSGEFTVSGGSDAIVRRFADVERMARCMPGASLEGQDAEGNYVGVMVVSFGPKRLRFSGHISFEVDPANRMGIVRGRGAGDVRGARVSFETRFTVVPEPQSESDRPRSRVSIHSVAELSGVIAEFARTGGIVVANILMQDFAKNFEADLTRADEDVAREAASPLSATKVLWTAVKAKFTQN